MTHDSTRPRVFIGSSREGIEVAENLQVLLDYSCEVEIWSQGIFEPGGATLASLARAASEFDFAVLVVSPEDTTHSRNEIRNTTRDNVIFELGLFMGALGSSRTFMVHDRTRPPDLPTDLAGVTAVTYQRHQRGTLTSSLGAAATQLKNAMMSARETRSPQGPDPRVTDHPMSTVARQELGTGGIERSDEHGYSKTQNVDSVLAKFVNYTGSGLSRDLHRELLKRGWTPSVPAKSVYIKWQWGPGRGRSLYQNSAQIVVASDRLVALLKEVPGVTPRSSKGEISISYAEGLNNALLAAEVLQSQP